MASQVLSLVVSAGNAHRPTKTSSKPRLCSGRGSYDKSASLLTWTSQHLDACRWLPTVSDGFTNKITRNYT